MLNLYSLFCFRSEKAYFGKFGPKYQNCLFKLKFSLCNLHEPLGVYFLVRLRLQFSHFNEHKFCHNFKDCVNPMWDWGAEIETSSHFFLRCQLFSNERQNSYDDVYQIDASIRNLNEKSF